YDATNLVEDYAKGPCDGLLSDEEQKRLRAVVAQDAPLAKRALMDEEHFNLAGLVDDVRRVLHTTLGAMALEDLRGHETMLRWVKEGEQYHRAHYLASCLLCGGELTEQRLRSLGQAIDGALDRISRDISDAKAKVEALRDRAHGLGLWPLGVVLVFELLSGFLAIECPIDRDAISVGSPVPGAGFRPENPDLAESALPQTLLGKEADLQFRLIQPTSVYRRVVNGEPIPQRPTLFLAEAVRQRLLGVGTQVVHDQMDGLRRGIAVGDGLDEVCKFQRRPGRGDLRKVNSCLRFDAAEYIGSSSTFVFIVALGHAARFHGQGFSDIVVKSHRLFLYAHHRLFGRQRPFIDFQHIFHRLDVFVIELGDAPHFFPATAEGRVLATRSELSRVLPWGPVCV